MAAGAGTGAQRGGAMAGGRAPRRRLLISPLCALKRKARPWACGGGEGELTKALSSSRKAAGRAHRVGVWTRARRDLTGVGKQLKPISVLCRWKKGHSGGKPRLNRAQEKSNTVEIGIGVRSPSMESQSWTPREEGRKGGGIRRVGPGGQRERWRGPAVSGLRERGSQRAAGPERNGLGEEGRGRTRPSGQNADGGKFSLFFCFFFLNQKLFKTHFKFILNLFLDF